MSDYKNKQKEKKEVKVSGLEKIISENENKMKDLQNQLSDSKYKVKEIEGK